MPLAEGKERIYVTVSTEMASRIDFYRERMGLSRSAFCAYLVGQGVMSMDKAMGVVDRMSDIMVSKAAEVADMAANNPDQLKLGACTECIHPCKDEIDPSEVGVCERFEERR